MLIKTPRPVDTFHADEDVEYREYHQLPETQSGCPRSAVTILLFSVSCAAVRDI